MKSGWNRRGLLRRWCAPAWATLALIAGGCVAGVELAEASGPAPGPVSASASPGIVALGDVQPPSVRVVVRGRTYQIEPEAWIDLMPPVDPNRGARAAIRVRALDGRPIPADLRLTRVQFIQPSGRSWVFTPRRISRSGAVAEFASPAGPRWDPGQNLSVAVTLSTGGRSAQGMVRGVVLSGAY
jgi:hypothetical protein